MAQTGTHINLNPATLLTAKIASAAQHLAAALEEWKAVQLFANSITTDGGGQDTSRLETNDASLVPSGYGAAVNTKIAYYADTLGAVAGPYDLYQG